jgi:hypothetical protein
VVDGVSLHEWKAKGLDVHSFIADPLFVDPENNDYRLRPESPAFQLGFRPIDLTDVGPRRVTSGEVDGRTGARE